MKGHLSCSCLLIFGLAMHAQAQGESDPPVLNPEVINKVIDMGTYLRSLPAFEVQAVVNRDTVLESGQKIKLQALTRLLVDGRKRLYAKADGDARSLEYFYDGKHLTQYSPRLKFYTTVAAPNNLADTLHEVEQHYSIELPLEDLFLFGSDQAQIDALKSAAYVGPSTIDGKACDHLAFRQENTDWQLWVTRGEQPLPCKLVITTTDDPSMPEYSATYRWNLKPGIKPAMFTFVPRKGDVAIALKKNAEEGQ